MEEKVAMKYRAGYCFLGQIRRPTNSPRPGKSGAVVSTTARKCRVKISPIGQRKDVVLTSNSLDVSKVLHFTDSKTSIKTDIESELSLHSFFDASKFSKIVKGKGGVYVDNYSSPAPKKHIKSFCPAAKKCLVVANAGGKGAIPSEALCIQYFHERFAAKNFLLEMEVSYNFDWKLVDSICNIYGHRVGISTTRAMSNEVFTEENGYQLLKKKLFGLVMARNCVSEEHSFSICFLHIWTPTIDIAQKLQKVYPRVVAEDDTGTFGEVIILASVYSDPWIYKKKS